MESILTEPAAQAEHATAQPAMDHDGRQAAAAEEPRPRSTYDEVPYSVGAFPQTRPEHLATIATLFGMRPAAPARCRVLELGCASGSNLIPMALADPGSRFVGIDLSGRQIADGQGVVRELGLPNLELRHASILDVGDELGEFDYIMCHGVYSWVPPEVQGRILQICQRNLAAQGVAYVSYNCYPGWHARGAIREMLWYHTEQFTDPLQRVRAARGLLVFLARSAAASRDGGYGALIRQELAVLLRTPDTYLLHEHLEEYNEPLYFHQFAQRAADQGLQYLGEAHIPSMVATRFGAEAEQTLRQISPDLLHMEQYMDFLRNRMFRQTLLCHADARLDHAMKPEIVSSFYITSPAKPVSASVDPLSDAPEEFKAAGPEILATRDRLMKAAMVCLADRWPMGFGFSELMAAAQARLGETVASPDAGRERQLAARLLNCYTSGLVELSLSPPAFTTEVTQRPVASAYARLRARDDTRVINMKLQSIAIDEPARIVLRQLDGSHDAGAVADAVAAWLEKQPTRVPLTGEAARKLARQYVGKLLPELGRIALLVA